MNKLGMSITESHINNPSVEEQIPLFAEIGFDTLFLSYGITDDFTKVPVWAKLARECGIEFEAVHAPTDGVNNMWISAETASDYIKRAKFIIDMCSEGQVGKMVLHVAWRVTPEPSEAGLESFSALEKYAESRGVRLCYENSHSAEHLLAAVNNCGEQHGFCLDVGHNNLYTPKTPLAGLIGEKIIYTHLHDNTGHGDKHMLPFDGNVNWEETTRLLRTADYTGTLNLELAGNGRPEYYDMTYREFATEAYRRLCKIRDMVSNG